MDTCIEYVTFLLINVLEHVHFFDRGGLDVQSISSTNNSSSKTKEGRKENVLFNDALNTFYISYFLYKFKLFMVIWRRTYGKGLLRQRERKPAAATWAILFERYCIKYC